MHRHFTQALALFSALLLFGGLLSPAPMEAATPPDGFADTLVASLSAPTALAFTPDGRMLIAQQTGQLRVYQNNALLVAPALDLTAMICRNSERGLLGVAVDPTFASNHFIYLYYTYNPFQGQAGACPTGQPTNAKIPVNRVSRFTLSNANQASAETILIDNIPSPNGNHNGGDLHFGQDGYLYISVGDGGADYASDSGAAGANDAARDQFILLGKILRITRDGGIPADNPFRGANSGRCNLNGRTTAQVCQETFARGLRNPFRFAFRPGTSEFYINDVGQDVWEEIDAGQSGADYGWNCKEADRVNSSSGKCSPTPSGLIGPVFAYQHGANPAPSPFQGCNSITGGAFVPAGVWPAPYDGAYLFADYVCNKILRLVPGGSMSAVEFASGAGGPTALLFGPYQSTQALYYAAIGSGQIRRISYTAAANRAPVAALTATPSFGAAPLTVSFSSAGSSDSDGDALTYDWDFGDGSAHATTAAATHQYALGTYTATLTVSDGKGGSAQARQRIDSGNRPPVPLITAPPDSLRYRVGQVITLQGSATDPDESAPLPGAQLSWQVLLHHNEHTHPFLPPTAGISVTITAPPPEDLAATQTSYLEVQLTATDAKGLTSVVTRTLQPHLVDITFRTVPADLQLLVNETPISTTQALVSWEGYLLNVSAPLQKDRTGGWLRLASWSDGGTVPRRTIVTPAATSTYTATFAPAWQRWLPLIP